MSNACVFSCYGDYLRSYYSKHSVTPDDKLPGITPCSEFINLALIDKTFSKLNHFSSSTLYGGPDEILANKTPIEIEALLTSDSSFVLVEGAPGIGKSTLCWELCRRWDTLKSLKHFKIILLLKLRERRVQQATTLNELFVHDDVNLSTRVVKEVLHNNGEGVLFILDGLDEMPVSTVRNKNNLIVKLINGVSMPKATRLVTSRPSALKLSWPTNYKHVEVLGFTNEKIFEFAKQSFDLMPDLFADFKLFALSNPVINSLMYIPMNCAIMAQVFKDMHKMEKLVPKTMTQLYTILFLVLIRRHMIDTKAWDEDSELPDRFDDLPENILASLKRISELAYKGLLVRKKIQLEFSSTDVGKDFDHLGILSISREMYARGPKVTYSFLHLTMQEFMAAWHVSCNPRLTKQVMDYYFFHQKNSSVPPVGVFLAGLSGIKHFPTIDNYYPSYFMITCFFEAQKPNDHDLFSCSPVLSRFYNMGDNAYSVELFSPLIMYMFGYVLAYAPIQWNVILARPLDVLASSLADYASEFKTRGCIEQLTITCSGFTYVNLLLRIEMLPKKLLQSVTTLRGELQINDIIPEEEQCLFYRSLRLFSKVKNFHLYFRDMTIKSMQELCSLFANNQTLESVKLEYMRYATPYTIQNPLKCQLHHLMDAIFVCSTIQAIATLNIPYKIRSTADVQCANLKYIVFALPIMGISMSNADLAESLYSLGVLCTLPSMQKIKVHIPRKLSITLLHHFHAKLLAHMERLESPPCSASGKQCLSPDNTC